MEDTTAATTNLLEINVLEFNILIGSKKGNFDFSNVKIPDNIVTSTNKPGENNNITNPAIDQLDNEIKAIDASLLAFQNNKKKESESKKLTIKKSSLEKKKKILQAIEFYKVNITEDFYTTDINKKTLLELLEYFLKIRFILKEYGAKLTKIDSIISTLVKNIQTLLKFSITSLKAINTNIGKALDITNKYFKYKQKYFILKNINTNNIHLENLSNLTNQDIYNKYLKYKRKYIMESNK